MNTEQVITKVATEIAEDILGHKKETVMHKNAAIYAEAFIKRAMQHGVPFENSVLSLVKQANAAKAVAAAAESIPAAMKTPGVISKFITSIKDNPGEAAKVLGLFGLGAGGAYVLPKMVDSYLNPPTMLDHLQGYGNQALNWIDKNKGLAAVGAAVAAGIHLLEYLDMQQPKQK
jgi:hypothetical protein